MTRVLLAEDNEDNFNMLSRRLTRQGLDVIGARDGQEAVYLSNFLAELGYDDKPVSVATDNTGARALSLSGASSRSGSSRYPITPKSFWRRWTRSTTGLQRSS